jgi:hypothetical protein
MSEIISANSVDQLGVVNAVFIAVIMYFFQ